MTSTDKTTLKSYFETGDIPTEAQFSTLIDSFERSFNPDDFGAVGDGIADDTAAVQAAIDAASVFGGIVRMDKSYGIAYTATTTVATYSAPYGLWVNADNIALMGSGKLLPITADINYYIILLGNGGAPSSHPGEGGTWTENIGIFGLTFDGSDLTTISSVGGILFAYTRNFYVMACRITELSGDGILGLATQREGRIIGNTIKNSTGVSHTNAGIHLDGGSYCLIQNNYVEQQYSLGIVIQSNLDNEAAGVCKFNTISNNIINNPYNIGIQVEGCQYSVFSGNYIYDAPTQAIRIRSSANASWKAESSHNVIVGNYIIRSSTTGTAISLVGYDSNDYDATPLLCQENFFAANYIEGHYVTKFGIGEQASSNIITEDNIWDQPGTFAEDDATPSVTGFNVWNTANANPTTITMLDNGYVGQRILVIIGDANTTIDFTGTNLKGNSGANWSPSNGDSMDCMFDGTNWYCQVADNTA